MWLECRQFLYLAGDLFRYLAICRAYDFHETTATKIMVNVITLGGVLHCKTAAFPWSEDLGKWCHHHHRRRSNLFRVNSKCFLWKYEKNLKWLIDLIICCKGPSVPGITLLAYTTACSPNALNVTISADLNSLISFLLYLDDVVLLLLQYWHS